MREFTVLGIKKLESRSDMSWYKICEILDNPHGKFLTLDIDWAADFVISECIDLVEGYALPATWFITHDTPLIDRLRSNPNFELGIHPNFNSLIEGKSSKSAEVIISDLMAIVPEAVSIRSHSLTQNSRLQNLFVDAGLKFECNHYIPYHSDMVLKPWKIWNGLIKAPHFWADDVALMAEKFDDCIKLIQHEGVKIFDFHPIHLYMNSENIERYENSRSCHRMKLQLDKCINQLFGTKNFLHSLITC